MQLIQMLRKESNSGQMHDLAHVRSEDCLADSLTKHSAKADELIKAVLTGSLLNVDAHPPFRTMLQKRAFLVEWLAHNTKHGPDIIAFAGVGIAESMFAYWGTWALSACPRILMHEFFSFAYFQFLNSVMRVFALDPF